MGWLSFLTWAIALFSVFWMFSHAGGSAQHGCGCAGVVIVLSTLLAIFGDGPTIVVAFGCIIIAAAYLYKVRKDGLAPGHAADKFDRGSALRGREYYDLDRPARRYNFDEDDDDEWDSSPRRSSRRRVRRKSARESWPRPSRSVPRNSDTLLRFEYADSDGVVTERTISNWIAYGPYIEGFCHLRRAHRTFRRDQIICWHAGEHEV